MRRRYQLLTSACTTFAFVRQLKETWREVLEALGDCCRWRLAMSCSAIRARSNPCSSTSCARRFRLVRFRLPVVRLRPALDHQTPGLCHLSAVQAALTRTDRLLRNRWRPLSAMSECSVSHGGFGLFHARARTGGGTEAALSPQA